MQWNVGDWVVLDMDVGQIKTSYADDCFSFSDGWSETSGSRIHERFRPLTLRSKRIVEHFKHLYKRLDEIDGSRGFNYPDISAYFSSLALSAIDVADDDASQFYDAAIEFLAGAREYKPVIQGVRLFRRAA